MRTLVLVFTVLSASGAEVVSVCQALQQRETLNGKHVLIRGRVEGGEGAWLVDDRCNAKTLGGVRNWQSSIWLEHPQSGSALGPVDFQRDENALRKIDLFVRRHPCPKGSPLFVTYRGRFETYPDLTERERRSGGQTIHLGFGHMGESPAQLIVRTAESPRCGK